MRTSIWLVRHGQTDHNRAQRYMSWSDSPLTSYGQQQAAALAHRLRRLPFDVALVSPVGRTQATAAALLEGRSATRQIDAPAWREVHHGRWEGLTYREVMARFPDEARARFGAGLHGKAQGGESLHEAAERIDAAWTESIGRFPGGRVLIVTHATPIQLVLCATCGMSPANHWRWRVDLGSLTCLDLYGSTAIVRMVNEVLPLVSAQGD